MKLAKIYNEVIKARLKDKRILLGDFDDETIGVSLDGYVMYFIPKNNFLLDENKILNTRDKMNLKNFKEPDELICVFQSCEYREYRERLLLKIGDKYVDKKLLQNFEKPSFKTTNSKYSAIYIYELDTLVGLVMPVNIKEDKMIRADFHDHRDGDVYVEWFDNRDEMMEFAEERYRECNIYVDRDNDKCYIVMIDDWEC